MNNMIIFITEMKKDYLCDDVLHDGLLLCF